MANTPNMPAPPAPGGFAPPGGSPVRPMSYGAPVNGNSGNSSISTPSPAAPRLSPNTQGVSQPVVAYGSTSNPKASSPVPGLIIGEGEVHTMPEKFLPTHTVKPHMGSVKKFALIGGSIVVVMVIITAVVVLIYSRPPAAVNQNVAITNTVNVNRTNTNSNTNANQNVNVNVNANTNSNTNTNTNLNSNANTNTNVNVNTNANTNSNTNTNSTEITSTKDTDKDGLTDNEEVIWGSGQNKPDTDGDGFLDGEEIANGYSPTSTATLSVDPNAKTYTNTSYHYSILYPARWVEGQLDNSDEDILLTAETGEFVEVTVTSNPKQQTAKEWYLDQFPDLKSKDLQTFETAGGLSGTKSQNGLTGYLATPDIIYVITYNIGTRTAANFLNTFDMMLKTFQVTQ